MVAYVYAYAVQVLYNYFLRKCDYGCLYYSDRASFSYYYN